MLYAAIDIGSNAIRLLFCNVFIVNGKPVFKKNELIRVPIRLGEDVFLKGEISEAKLEKMVYAFKAFNNLIKVYNPISYRAVATSAMRDAKNGPEVVKQILSESGIQIDIVDGQEEARLIFVNDIVSDLDTKNNYLYIDVGGGSVELTLFENKKIIASKSFNVGTLRMLHQTIAEGEWDAFKQWGKKYGSSYKPLVAIGSGGNINKIYKMIGKKDSFNLNYSKIRDLHDMLSVYTVQERVEIHGLNPDRADVIIPASKIFMTIMKQAEIEKILVPQIGLSDGIIHDLYLEDKKK